MSTPKTSRKLDSQVLVSGLRTIFGDTSVIHELGRLSGETKARLVVIIATEHPAEVSGIQVSVFRCLGYEDAVRLDLPDRAAAVASANAAKREVETEMFFNGGNHLRITNLLGGTPIDSALHWRRAEGLAIGGTSAGATMMSGTMIVGGVNEAAPRAGRSRSGRG